MSTAAVQSIGQGAIQFVLLQSAVLTSHPDVQVRFVHLINIISSPSLISGRSIFRGKLRSSFSAGRSGRGEFGYGRHAIGADSADGRLFGGQLQSFGGGEGVGASKETVHRGAHYVITVGYCSWQLQLEAVVCGVLLVLPLLFILFILFIIVLSVEVKAGGGERGPAELSYITDRHGHHVAGAGRLHQTGRQ